MSKTTVKLADGSVKSIGNWAARDLIERGEATLYVAKTKDEPAKETKTVTPNPKAKAKK